MSYSAPVPYKSTAVAYLLWFFLGSLGVHKFYMQQNGLGIAYLIAGLIGWVTAVIGIGLFVLAVLGVALLVDIFIIPGRVQLVNHRLASGAVPS